MPPTSSASTDERRVAAHQARLARTERIARLRRQVLAAALATFALAFGVVAFDGSMGSAAAGSSAAATSSGQTAQEEFSPSGDDLSTGATGDTDPAPAASSSDALTTSQS
jgi:hypothetical protein